MADQAIYSPMRVFDGNGDPVPGALVTFYASGTLTLIDVWQDAAGAVAATNPVVADGDGNLPQRFVGQAAKAVITDALGVTIRTIDPVPVSLAAFGAASTISFSPSASLPVSNVQGAIELVDDKVADLGDSYLRFDVEQILSGPETTQVWENLYLGSLAGKEKISVPGDINASGTPADWSVLFGDGVWRSIFGLGVQWFDLTASRAKDTVYQNANGRAIAVTVTSSGGFIDRQLQVSADNTTWRTISDFNFSGTSTVTGVVPSGHYYRFVSSGTMFRWMELRS